MTGASSPQETSKQEADALMEYLRNNPPQVKSINEVVNLLHVISAEQRSCNVLRSCVDKVLMNMSNIRTLRDIIERLRSVSRTNGFRFELPTSSSPETRCRLVSDMFSVKILLGTSNTPDHSPTVLDVSIQHTEREEYRTSPHLVNVIRSGNFLELSGHLKGLTEMYLTSGSKYNRIRVYMALQSLETDLVKMSQIYRETHTDASCFDITMEGTVGMLTPRVAGDRSHFAYYISPYDLIDTSTRSKISLGDTVPKHIGLHAEVGIEHKSTTCNLPIAPLITNKHPVDNTGMARFLDVNQHNSMTVPISASFVLYLKPAVPVLTKVSEAIKKITGLDLSSEDNLPKPYLELLNTEKKMFKIPLGDECHIYHLNLSELRGTLVNKIYFTHPGHVTEILDLLRKQAHLNTLISSCIRDNILESKKAKQWYFEVSCSHIVDRVNVTMEHPTSNGTAFLEIGLDKRGFQSCKIFTGRGDPPLCADEFVAKILRKCSSLPITMRKLIEQSIKNPRKESEVKRARPLFAPSSHLPSTTHLLTPVQKTPIPQPRIISTSVMSTLSGAAVASAFQFAPSDEHDPTQKKVTKNPMLTQLLIPNTGGSTQLLIPNTGGSTDSGEPAVQMKNHPMLMGLLKDDSEQEQIPVSRSNSNRGGKLPNTQMGYQPNQLAMGVNQQNQYVMQQQSNPMGFMSPSTLYPNMEPPIPVPVLHPMPPPSYPSQHPQSQFSGPGQLPNMSPAQHSPANAQQFQIPHSPYPSQRSPMGGIDDMNGPVTPTNPFGMMSPGLPQTPNMQPLGRGRRPSRQKSHSIENTDFGSFDLPQDAFQPPMSMEPDSVMSEILAMQNRTGMTPLRRTDSMSPGGSIPQHLPLQHSSSLKSISENMGNNNMLHRSISSGSGKGSARSLASPRNLRTPEAAMMALGSPPMFDNVNLNQRGSRGKSFDGQGGDFFRSQYASVSPGGMGGINIPLSADSMHVTEMDIFTFDDNKNPSKISMSDTSGSGPVSRNTKPPLYHTNSAGKETLQDLAKMNPALMKELMPRDQLLGKPTESSVMFHRQLSNSTTAGLMPNLTSIVANKPLSAGELTNRLMTSTSVTTISERNLVRQNAVDKQVGQSGTQTKTGDIKNEKAVRRRNSSKNEEGKAPAKKRGRPPTVKDHGGKRKKGDNVTTPTAATAQQDETGSNASITLNIQLSSTGAPISSTTKTKPIVGVPQPQQKNQPTPESVAPTLASGTNNNAGANAPAGPSTAEAGIEKYLKSQMEFATRRKKEMKDKKVSGKAPSSVKQSFNTQSSSAGIVASAEKTISIIQTGKQPTSGSVSPRSGSGPVPQKRPRKNSGRIQDVIDKLQYKMPATSNVNLSSTSPISTDISKQIVEKDANSNLLMKSKSLLGSPSYQKTSIGMLNKMPIKAGSEDKTKVGGLGIKTMIHSKSIPAKAPLNVMTKTTVFSPPNIAKTVPPGVDLVLKRINETAAATATKRVIPTLQNKNQPTKVPRAVPPVKARSVTPTSSMSSNNSVQRKSPSSQMLKALTSDALIRQVQPKQQTTNMNATVKKSPVRNLVSGGPTRPSSAPTSGDVASSMILPKTVSTSPTSTLVSLSRKQHLTPTPGDQLFVAPSISPTPKRMVSPQISRTTSPLTRIDDKANKGMPGRSPHRPSPTQSRIATPIPFSNPQSPDDRLVIDDASAALTALSRDEQRPLFIPGVKINPRQSPERTVMPSPMSPPQQKGSNLLQGTKRAPTPRFSSSPGMSPIMSSASPYPIDDDLMNQAVTG